MNDHAAAKPDTLQGLIDALRAEEARIQLGGGAGGDRAAAREGPADRPRADRAAGRSRHRRCSSSACGRRGGMYAEWGGAPAAGVVTAIGTVARPAAHDHRQRRHGEGRGVLPDDGQEGAAGPADRHRRTGCRSSTSSIRPASSCRCRKRSFPTRTTSAASSATTPSSRPRAFRRSRPSWATASPAAATCRCCATSC